MFPFSVFLDENFGVIYIFSEASLEGVRLVSIEDNEGAVVNEDFKNCFH